MDEACTKALAPGEHRRLVGMLEDQGVAPAGTGARWLQRVARATLAALTARGEATARELTKDVPELGAKLNFGEGKTWGGTMGVSTRILFLLATEGRIVRARPLGRLDLGPVPVGADRDLARRAAAEDRPRRGVRRAARPVAPGVRAGDRDGRPLVDGVDREARRDDARGARCRRGRARRGARLRPARRSRAGPRGRTLGGAAPGARPDGHGLEGTGLVPRRARDRAVRPQRQRRPDRLGGRPRGRRVDADRRRRGARRAPRAGRRRDPHVDRTRARAAAGVARRRADQAAVPHAARAIAHRARSRHGATRPEGRSAHRRRVVRRRGSTRSDARWPNEPRDGPGRRSSSRSSNSTGRS